MMKNLVYADSDRQAVSKTNYDLARREGKAGGELTLWMHSPNSH